MNDAFHRVDYKAEASALSADVHFLGRRWAYINRLQCREARLLLRRDLPFSLVRLPCRSRFRNSFTDLELLDEAA